LIAWLAPKAPAIVAQARSHSARRFSSSAAPPSAIACQSRPCSPSFENERMARSAPGVWPALRNAR
jgi:hypothetical protein